MTYLFGPNTISVLPLRKTPLSFHTRATHSGRPVRRLKRAISVSCSQQFLQGVAFAVSPVATRRQGAGDRINAVPAVPS